MKSLILGGTKSGKSRLAERWAEASGLPVTVIATAQALDTEMQARIAHHQATRPKHWHLVEAPIMLGHTLHATVQNHAPDTMCIIVDCLTLWLTQVIMQDCENKLQQEVAELLDAVKQSKQMLIVVSNETNMGIVPANKLSRRYMDEVGLLHQNLATQCDNVVLTIAGLPHALKGTHSKV